MKAYSLDLRERIVAALEEGASVVSVAQRFSVGERTVRTYRARAKVGARTTAELVWILGPRLPEPDGVAGRTSLRSDGLDAEPARVETR